MLLKIALLEPGYGPLTVFSQHWGWHIHTAHTSCISPLTSLRELTEFTAGTKLSFVQKSHWLRFGVSLARSQRQSE